MTENTHKAGFVNLIGNPNVGKSTLMNRLVGENLSIITPKAQTTRHRIKGIVNGPDFQIVYSDLPGVLNPAYKMQEMMMRFVNEALKDADVILYMVECGRFVNEALKDADVILYMVECGEKNYNPEIIERLQHFESPILLIINKIDKCSADLVEETATFWKDLLPKSELFPISALVSTNLDLLMTRIVELLPLSPPFFPKDELTDKPVRFFISEIIREKILFLYKKEIPYSVEVVVESFKESDDIVRIGAMLYCERDTQKGIIIGNKGSAIKQLGIDSRASIEAFLEKKVYLDLSVKVLKDWRDQDLMMKRFGYFEG